MVYAGGSFNMAGGQLRSNLASLDLATGAVTSWNPSANGIVRALAANAGMVYAGGEFIAIGGDFRPYLASAACSRTREGPAAIASPRSMPPET